jgi:hypothetical protein
MGCNQIVTLPRAVSLNFWSDGDLVACIARSPAPMGVRFRRYQHCGAKLLSKGYYRAKVRSVFGDVDVRIRRLRVCGSRAGKAEPKSFAGYCQVAGVGRRWQPDSTSHRTAGAMRAEPLAIFIKHSVKSYIQHRRKLLRIQLRGQQCVAH